MRGVCGAEYTYTHHTSTCSPPQKNKKADLEGLLALELLLHHGHELRAGQRLVHARHVRVGEQEEALVLVLVD